MGPDQSLRLCADVDGSTVVFILRVFGVYTDSVFCHDHCCVAALSFQQQKPIEVKTLRLTRDLRAYTSLLKT